VWLTEASESEYSIRRSVITGGVVVPSDDGVLSVYGTSGKMAFTVTLTRLDKWEFDDVVTTPSGGWSVDAMGGLQELPVQMSTYSGQDGRIANIVLRGALGGYMRKVWMGIWPNRTGFSSSGLHPDTWNPEVRWTGYSLSRYPLVTFHSEDTKLVSDSNNTVLGRRVQCDFSSTTDWKTRMSIDLSRFNDVYQGYASAERPVNILGEFKFIQRYRVRGHAGTLVGVRFGVGFGDFGKHISWSNPMWLRKIHDSNGVATWHNAEFGMVNIGNSSWSPEVRSRFSMKGLRLYMQCSLERTGSIDFDCGWLVPTYSSIYIDAGRDVKPSERIEVFVSPRGTAHGFIVESSASEPPGTPLSAPRSISGEIPTISTQNWVMPREMASLMVFVSDRDDPFSKDPSGKIRVDMAVQKRASIFATYNTFVGGPTTIISKKVGGEPTPIS
jgi:hypothetical protein